MLSVEITHKVGALDLSVRFECGSAVTALFGRSGAGKTTIVSAIAGLMQPSAGRIVLDEVVFFDANRGINVPASDRRIGYVFQEGRLFPHLDVRRNLTFSRWFRKDPEGRRHLDAVVTLLGLGGLLTRRPADLSGGERQRVAIGRALLSQPRLLLLDEPLSALDIMRKSEILRHLELLRDETRIPMVYVSHAIEEVVRLASDVVLLSDGRVVASGPVDQVLSDSSSRPYSGRYEAGAVIVGRVLAQDTESGLGRIGFTGGELQVADLDALPGETVRVRIRARDVALAIEAPRGTTIRNILAGQVTRIVETEGSMAEADVDVGGARIIARVTRQSIRDLRIGPGTMVYALVKAIALDRHAVGYA